MKPFTTLHFDITNRCNLNCIHCRVIDRGDYEITPEDVKKIIRDIKNHYEIKSFTIGGGEPLIRKDCIEFIKICKSEVPEASIGITSNGLLLTQDFLNKIKGLVDTFQVSIDGSNATIHDTIRQCEGSFDKAVNAIKLCHDAEMQVSVRTTLMRPNIDDIPNILNKLQEWDVRYFGIRRVLPQGNALKHWDDLTPSPKEYIDTLENVINILENTKPYIHYWGGDPIMNIINFKGSVMRACKDKNIDLEAYFINENNRFKWYSGCAAGSAYLYIAANGDFCICPMLPSPIGNAIKTPISELINNIVIQRIKLRSLKGKCGECKAKYICGGCRASAFHATGDILGEDPVCPLKYGYNLEVLNEKSILNT